MSKLSAKPYGKPIRNLCSVFKVAFTGRVFFVGGHCIYATRYICLSSRQYRIYFIHCRTVEFNSLKIYNWFTASRHPLRFHIQVSVSRVSFVIALRHMCIHFVIRLKATNDSRNDSLLFKVLPFVTASYCLCTFIYPIFLWKYANIVVQCPKFCLIDIHRLGTFYNIFTIIVK